MLKTSPSVGRARIVLAVLLVLNLVAAGLVLYPPGGSAEALERQSVTLRTQLQQGRGLLDRTRTHTGAVATGRKDGDQFLNHYFLPRRSAYITILSELGEVARKSRLKERENAFAIEAVEGSDDLSMMTVTANYEGTYRDLVAFVREIDHSDLLVMIDSLSAAPQAGSNTLLLSMKIDAFVREDGSAVPKPEAVATLNPAEVAR